MIVANMKFSELLAYLAVALREDIRDLFEMHRAVREGCEKIHAKDIALLRARGVESEAIDAPFDWNASGFRKLFRGRPGPGGGMEADAFALGFFLIAYLTDGPRREAAERAVELTYAKYLPRDGETVCPLTGQRYFLGALKTILTNLEVFDRAEIIRISSDAGFARIEFNESYSIFFVNRKDDPGKFKPLHREHVLLVPALRSIFDFINAPETSKSKAMAWGNRMVRRCCPFRETDLKRALRAARAAGVPVQIKIKNGEMTVTMMDNGSSAGDGRDGPNEWEQMVRDEEKKRGQSSQ